MDTTLIGVAGDTGTRLVPSFEGEGMGERANPSGPDRAPSVLDDLDLPDLVFSDGYVGPDRRTPGLVAQLRRSTFAQRRSVFSLEVAVVLVAVVVVVTVLMVGSDRPGASTGTGTGTARSAGAGARALPAAASPGSASPTSASPATVPAASRRPAAEPSTATPAAAAAPTTTPTPSGSTATATDPTASTTAGVTPDQLGAEALALVRYPWQKIPGYSIQFLPISDAPSPGFYGNTTFTWGHTGGVSTLYVYPGETVQHLAGITAFEIGHEVDAAAVEPQGGEAAIENILGIHPASWAPPCDCAEQGYLSGWYSAAFSAYWSPGVGAWSTLAPLPTGEELAAVEPWLDPTIP